MKAKFTREDPSYNSHMQWGALCKEGTYVTVAPSALSGLVSDGLLSKANSVLVMASASGSTSVYVANINRVDMPASAIDQEPYIAAFDHGASAASGGYVHHGNWKGRTDVLGQLLYDAVSASGITACFPLREMPASSSGVLQDLPVDSQHAAFWASVLGLKNSTE